MTYEQLKKANESISTMEIKDKDYVPVNQRIKAFRMVYPDGFILTELMSNENGVCIFRAKVGYEDERGHHVLGTGTSWEKETSSYINKTSYIENSETSAVGRALGMAGFGIDMSVASAEEVQNAINNQGKTEAQAEPKEEPKKKRLATPEQVRLMNELFTDAQKAAVLGFYKVKTLEEVSMKAASELIKKANEKKGEAK